jgi:hypothetical protein
MLRGQRLHGLLPQGNRSLFMNKNIGDNYRIYGLIIVKIAKTNC